MSKKGYVPGILGSVLTLTVIMAAPVKAETKEESILNKKDWSKMAAANVENYANIRSSASTDSDVVGVLGTGCAVEIEEQGQEWSKIVSGDVEGYIRNDLLVFGEEAKEHYKNTRGIPGTVVADALRIRKEPGTDAAQIGTLGKNSKVSILGEENDWYQIRYADDTAYVHADYVEAGEELEGALSMEEFQKQQQSAIADGADVSMLAALIECEAGGESRTGKVAVGAVVRNRVMSGSFPNSISGVIYQSGQFTPVASGKFQSVLARGARSDCYEAARAALAGENPIGGCLYFNSGYGRGIQIGYQHFY